jgi:5-methyltetrahydrofolate--homocysteine methyltransferase
MGVNAPAEAFVEAAKEAGQAAPLVVGLSAFVTSARRELVKVMELLKAEGLDARVILGGAAVNRSLTDQLGAAGYAKDAVAAVKLMERLTTA